MLSEASTLACSKDFSFSLEELQHMTVCKELHNACKEHGYFFIKNFNAATFPLDKVFSEAAAFFNLPEQEKLKNIASNSSQYLGYRRLGAEISVMTGDPELCEQYKFGYFHDKNTRHSTLLLDYWETYKSVFEGHTKACFFIMEQIASDLLKTIADNVGLGRDYFQSYCNQPTHQLGLNHYPNGSGTDESSKNYAMSAHKDLCLLTIIAQNQSGLMLQNLAGEWKLIPNKPNTLLVLIGDYLERWTNGYYPAPIHQVIESVNNARISIIYKHRPNYETVIPVIPGINPLKACSDFSEAFHTGKAYEQKINYIMGNSALANKDQSIDLPHSHQVFDHLE